MYDPAVNYDSASDSGLSDTEVCQYANTSVVLLMVTLYQSFSSSFFFFFFFFFFAQDFSDSLEDLSTEFWSGIGAYSGRSVGGRLGGPQADNEGGKKAGSVPNQKIGVCQCIIIIR